MATRPSHALGRPRPQRTKRPERLAIEVNEKNRAVLQDMLDMLSDRVGVMECEQPPRPKHLRLTRIARNMIANLLTQNPRELLIDPDDVVRRGVLFFLDECCWAMMKKRAAAEEAARYQEQRRYPYYGRGIPGHEYYAHPPGYGYRHPNDDYDY